MRDECQCECRVVNNKGADGNTWSQLFPLCLCLIHLLTYNAKLLRQTCMCLLSVTSLLTHSFCLWHMHAFSFHLLVYSCWIINFWVGWCDSNTHRDTHKHSHTRTQTLTWDWINTPFCSAEGGIDIILGLGPNTLLSFRKKREAERGGERETGHEPGGKKRGWLSGNMLTCRMCVQHPTSTPWTLSFMWSSRVVFPSFLFFQQ